MPLFASLFSSFFGALGAFLTKLFVAKVAVRVAAVAALASLGGVLMVTFNGIVAPLVAQAFSTAYGQFLGLAFPPVAGTCMAGIAGLWLACTTYKLQERAIMVTAGI